MEIHGGAVEVTFADAAPRSVVADRRRLGQALGNIIDNANRYGDGLRRVTVESVAGGRFTIGQAIEVKSLSSRAPSTRAASSTSSGTAALA